MKRYKSAFHATCATEEEAEFKCQMSDLFLFTVDFMETYLYMRVRYEGLQLCDVNSDRVGSGASTD
jgi:hypothetical protein